MFLLPVHALRNWTDAIFELEVERRGYPFVPGECAVMFNDGLASRPYSIASGPDESVLRFLIRRQPGGAVSTWLGSRRPGDGVRISTPFGAFRPGQEPDSTDPGVFVATGVGIAPFLSYARSTLAGRGGPRPRCLYGVRQRADAVHLDLLGRVTDLRLAISREVIPGTHHGRVTDLLDQAGITAETPVYLCGLDAMVDDAVRWLAHHGLTSNRIHVEVFFSSPGAGGPGAGRSDPPSGAS